MFLKMNKIIFSLHLVLLLTATQIFGQQSSRPVNFNLLVDGGVEYGGDEILQVFFTNGEDQTMRAGQGGYIGFGGQLEFSSIKKLMLRTTIGIKYNTTAADNANIRLTRYPLSLTPFWKINDDIRLGIGITTHLSPRLRGDGFIPDISYDSTIGTRFEFGYKWIALTYTVIRYENEAGEFFSAGSIGGSLSFTIPNKK